MSRRVYQWRGVQPRPHPTGCAAAAAAAPPRRRRRLLRRGAASELSSWAGALAESEAADPARLAVGETVTLLHPLLPSVGVSIRMERGCQ